MDSIASKRLFGDYFSKIKNVKGWGRWDRCTTSSRRNFERNRTFGSEGKIKKQITDPYRVNFWEYFGYSNYSVYSKRISFIEMKYLWRLTNERQQALCTSITRISWSDRFGKEVNNTFSSRVHSLVLAAFRFYLFAIQKAEANLS